MDKGFSRGRKAEGGGEGGRTGSERSSLGLKMLCSNRIVFLEIASLRMYKS